MSSPVPSAASSGGPSAQGGGTATLFLAGDVMTGRGIDQVLPFPADPRIYEYYTQSAEDYVRLAERANGPIARPVSFDYIWGDALAELERRTPDVRIINLETAITNHADPEPKGINYRMSPANAGAIIRAGIDCCVLANNHVLDWGPAGLLESLVTLERAGIACAGAGRDDAAAASPAILELPGKGRVLVFGIASPTSGVPLHWRARADRAGINIVPELSPQAADRIGRRIAGMKGERDIVVVSIHWGPNWGYDIPREQIEFAHRLIEAWHVDIVYGHSSHHSKGIEVYQGKLILYGTGDFIDDYEGISGHEAFRDDLVLMFFPTVRLDDGRLSSLEMVPLQIRNMRLHHARSEDAAWLARTLDRESKVLNAGVRLDPDGVLRLAWS